MESLVAFKDYLTDRPETAILALSLLANFYLFRKYDQAKVEQVKMVELLAPLTDKLCRMIERVGAFVKRWNGAGR